jgi:hypothetical protein
LAKTHYELDQLSETQKLELHLFTTIALLVTQAKPSVCQASYGRKQQVGFIYMVYES